MEPFITFILPTIGRPSLLASIRSVLNQTDLGWKLLVIFDGVQPSREAAALMASDSRIQLLVLEKQLGTTGKLHGTAGAVRNRGAAYVTTPWTGFVDDDDTLTPHYVASARHEVAATPDVECIVFRMLKYDFKKSNRITILPALKDKALYQGGVGISFCLQTDLFKKRFPFLQGELEDFILLKGMERQGRKILISNRICYLVNNDVLSASNVGNKILQFVEQNEAKAVRSILRPASPEPNTSSASGH
jgi:glycosyltransferase involved in cell wall biosynthesis